MRLSGGQAPAACAMLTNKAHRRCLQELPLNSSCCIERPAVPRDGQNDSGGHDGVYGKIDDPVAVGEQSADIPPDPF
jgi:hypothetical protein